MTMTASQNEVEYLATEILTNLKPVTYHTFSRQLSLPISKAKSILFEYYEKNKDALTASFIITGSSKSGKLIKLSKEEDFDSDIKLFENVNCVHIYSVFKKQSDFTTTDIAREELKFPSSFNKISEYEKNGMIKGPKNNVVIQQDTPVFTVPSTPSSLVGKKVTRKEEPKKASTISSGLSSTYVSRKLNKNQSPLPLKGISSGYVSRKTESSVPTKRSNTEPAKPSYEYKSRKLEAKAPKERVIVSSGGDEHTKEDDNDDDHDNEPVKATRATNTSDLQRMFDDDDFTFSDDNEETPKEQTEELKSEIDQGSIQKLAPSKEEELLKEQPEEQPQEPSLFVQDDAAAEEDETQEPVASVDPSEEKDSLFVQEEDEEGYIVTRKVKPVTKPPRANKAINRPAPAKVSNPSIGAKKDGKKKQASLLDFFGKKK